MSTSMKFAVVVPNDQTIGYLTEDGAVTVLPSEAQLFDTKQSAELALDESSETDFDIDEIEDVAGFRAQPPTWGDRPVSMQTLFELAIQIRNHLDNENLRSEKFGVRSEAYLLQSAAHVFVKALGHQTPDGAWLFGKAPS